MPCGPSELTKGAILRWPLEVIENLEDEKAEHNVYQDAGQYFGGTKLWRRDEQSALDGEEKNPVNENQGSGK